MTPSFPPRRASDLDRALRAVARLSEELRLRCLAERPSPGLWDRRRDVRPDRSSPPQESSQCGERPCGHFPRFPLPPFPPLRCRPSAGRLCLAFVWSRRTCPFFSYCVPSFLSPFASFFAVLFFYLLFFFLLFPYFTPLYFRPYFSSLFPSF